MLNRVLLLVPMLALVAMAQSVGTWQTLQQLAPGTVLKVDDQRPYCELVQVTETSLECGRIIGKHKRQVVIQRSGIRQVRLAVEKPRHHRRNTVIAAAAGEALGALWFHWSAGSDKIASEPGVIVAAGLPIAAIFGLTAHSVGGHSSFRDGPTIYRASEIAPARALP